jgi:hypothetical protein
MRTLLDAAHWLLTLLLGAGYFDTRRKIKAERRLRQENSDISSIDQAIKGLEDLRGIYARRRSKRAWRRSTTDDEVMKAEMALENTVLRVTDSEDLRRAIEDYKDVGGQYAGRAEEIGVETELKAYSTAVDALTRRRERALEP